MVFLSFIILFALSCWLFLEKSVTKWGSALIFNVSLGILSEVIDVNIFPLLVELNADVGLYYVFSVIKFTLSFVFQVSLPYLLLAFSLYSYEQRNKRRRAIIVFVSAIPILSAMILYQAFFHEEVRMHNFTLVLLAGYVTFTSTATIYAYIRGENGTKKKVT